MLRAVLAAAVLSSMFPGEMGAQAMKLTAFERAQGWRLLFDGESLSDWRGFKSRRIPSNWQVKEGSLHGFSGPAIVTAEEFGDFELTFDWRVAEGGHGEVYFHVGEDAAHPEESGPVMELSGHGPALGSNSGLSVPERRIPPQAGVWHRSRIVVFGDFVEYHVAGDRVMGFVIGSAAWKEAVANSRFAAFPNFSRYRRGAIALSGEAVEFRNIRIRTSR
jgi:hypothetical protein